MSNLPLSWCRKDAEISSYQTAELPLSGMTWITAADIPLGYTEKDIYQDLTAHYPDFIVRGLSLNTAKYFQEMGAVIVRTGAEAVVDLKSSNHSKNSLFELAKRGWRHGSVTEVPYSKFNREKLSCLINDSSHGKEPRLLHLYRAGFDKSVRCFVLTSTEGLWLGAVTISIRDGNSAHTESIVRRKDAPVGVMEALFTSLIETLKDEGFTNFSLGEVPFAQGDNHTELCGSYINELVFRTRILIGRSFDYKGLYNFKNKFGPKWSPVYLAARPRISPLLLIDLYFKSRFHDLTVFKVLSSLKKRFQLPHKTA